MALDVAGQEGGGRALAEADVEAVELRGLGQASGEVEEPDGGAGADVCDFDVGVVLC